MNIDLFVLIIWLISGTLTIMQGITSDNYKVPLGSYFLCWFILIIYLIEKI